MGITSRGPPQSTELKRCVYLVFQQPLRYLLTASPACDSFLRQRFALVQRRVASDRLCRLVLRRRAGAELRRAVRPSPLRGSRVQRGKPSRANSVPRIAGVYATRQIASSLPRLIRVAVSSTIHITTLGMRPYSLGEVPEQGKKPLLTSGNRK